MSQILFFDTETTGLPRYSKAHFSDLGNWPRIVQLSWVIAHSDGEIKKTEDNIIKPEGYEIPKEAANVHGITTEIAIEKGSDLTQVLETISEDIEEAQLLVCHNLSFDLPILKSELHRKKLNTDIRKSTFCTMKSSTNYCRIPNRYGFKWPKLEELYMECFNKPMENAHNALADVMATQKCYFYLKNEGVF